MKIFRDYILPFIVLSLLIQFKTYISDYRFSFVNNIVPVEQVDKIAKDEKAAPGGPVILTRTAISFHRKADKKKELLHFALPEVSFFDFRDIGKYVYEVVPKGTTFQLIDNNYLGNSYVKFNKGNIVYTTKRTREEYSIYKETNKKAYDGTMISYMNPEFDRFSEDLEKKLLSGKTPIKVSQCYPPQDQKYGRQLEQYSSNISLYQQLLTDYFDQKQRFISQFKLEKRIKIIDPYLRPIQGQAHFLFCSQLEFNDLEAYVVYQNLPSL